MQHSGLTRHGYGMLMLRSGEGDAGVKELCNKPWRSDLFGMVLVREESRGLL